MTDPTVAPPDDPVEVAERIRLSAHARMTEAEAALAATKAALLDASPAEAVRRGEDLGSGAERHHALTHKAGFLADAIDAARVAHLEAQRAVDRVRTEAIHRPRLQAGDCPPA